MSHTPSRLPNPAPSARRAAPTDAGVGRRPSAAPARILKATEQLLLDGGIDAVSIRKVSDACGYSAPTIYHHFGDKRGLIDAVVEARFRVIYRVMESIPRHSDASRYLREVVTAFIDFALEHPDHYRLLTMPLENEPNVPSAEAGRELVRTALDALAEEGTLATPDVEAAFQVIWAVLHGLTSLQLSNTHYAFVDDLTQIALDMVEAGLLRRNAAAPAVRRTARRSGGKASE